MNYHKFSPSLLLHDSSQTFLPTQSNGDEFEEAPPVPLSPPPDDASSDTSELVDDDHHHMVVQSSPNMVVQSSPNMVVQSSPSIVVQSSPNMVVQSSPNMVVQSSPNMVVHTSPNMVVQTSPTMVVQTSPTMVVQSSPNMVVQSSPSMVVQSSPTMVVQSSPTMVVQSSPNMVVQSSPNMVDQTLSKNFTLDDSTANISSASSNVSKQHMWETTVRQTDNSHDEVRSYDMTEQHCDKQKTFKQQGDSNLQQLPEHDQQQSDNHNRIQQQQQQPWCIQEERQYEKEKWWEYEEQYQEKQDQQQRHEKEERHQEQQNKQQQSHQLEQQKEQQQQSHQLEQQKEQQQQHAQDECKQQGEHSQLQTQLPEQLEHQEQHGCHEQRQALVEHYRQEDELLSHKSSDGMFGFTNMTAKKTATGETQHEEHVDIEEPGYASVADTRRMVLKMATPYAVTQLSRAHSEHEVGKSEPLHQSGIKHVRSVDELQMAASNDQADSNHSAKNNDAMLIGCYSDHHVSATTQDGCNSKGSGFHDDTVAGFHDDTVGKVVQPLPVVDDSMVDTELLQNEIDNQSSQQSLNALYAKVDKNKTHKNLKGVECTSTSDEIKLRHISIQPSGLLMKSTSSQDLKENGTEVNDPRRHSALPASGDFSGDATYDVPDFSPTARSTQMMMGEKFQPTYDEDWSQLQTSSVEKLQVLSFTLYGYVSNGDIIGHVRSRIYISYWWKVGEKYSSCKQS